MRDPNGLEYYRVTSDITSFFPRIRFERRNEPTPQQASKSALEHSTDLYGDYSAYATEGGKSLISIRESAAGSSGLKLPTI